MRILLLAVGRDRGGPTADLAETYRKRCPWRIDFVDIPPRTQGDRAKRLGDEAAKIRQALPDGAAIAVLDERGDNLSSQNFARKIEGFQDDGRQALAFIIGSADGLDKSLTERADLRLAFGRATWPHRLVRVMLMEQIYRGATILGGHPYHRE